jgi:hypothetical protein
MERNTDDVQPAPDDSFLARKRTQWESNGHITVGPSFNDGAWMCCAKRASCDTPVTLLQL